MSESDSVDTRMREIRERRDVLRRQRQEAEMERGDMAEPQLQIERRMERVEKALLALAGENKEEVERILEGRDEEIDNAGQES